MNTTTKPTYSLYNKSSKNYRIFELDFFRGLAIALVLMDHLFFNLYYFGSIWNSSALFFDTIFHPLKEFAFFYWNHPIRIWVRRIVIMGFFVISGISSSFSRNNRTRGFRILAVAIAITIVSALFSMFTNSNNTIYFNAIHVFGVCALVYYLLQNVDWKITALVIVIVFLVGIYLGINPPNVNSLLLAPFAIYPPNIHPADMMSITPWLGFFLIGCLIGKFYYADKGSLFVKNEASRASRPILFLGRHSLLFYFGEQVVLFPIFFLIGLILGFPVF